MLKKEVRQYLTAMELYGGSFVKALAECIKMADPINKKIIESSFPALIEHYKQIAEMEERIEVEKWSD